MRTLHEVARQFPAAAEQGLTLDQVVESRRQFGSNRLTPLPHQPAWKRFLAKFNDPIIKILLAAAALSFLIASFGPFLGLAPGRAWLDGLAVLLAIILATGVAFASEYKSDREFDLLNARRTAQQVKVLRADDFRTIPLEEVVVGDLVMLEAGDEIPADGCVVKAAACAVAQSLMTGESEPVAKFPRPGNDNRHDPEQPDFLYRGTQIADGMAEMLVTEVGDATYLGQIARHLSEPDVESEASGKEQRVRHRLALSRGLTPLQQKLQHLAQQISKVGYLAALAIFCALLIQGLWRGELGWTNPGPASSAAHLLNYFTYMVIIIVVAVPEGLPMSVTVSLALAMRKLTRANCLVRQLVACETIGSATVICTDKTGTLTQNQMQVVRISWDGQVLDRDTPDWRQPRASVALELILQPGKPGAHHLDLRPCDWMLLNAAANSTAHLEEKQGKLVVVGNATEGALLLWLRDMGHDYRKLRLATALLAQVHFSSERKRMTSVLRLGDQQVLLTKGAPEAILKQSTHYQTSAGICAWTTHARSLVEGLLDEATRQAMRPLAFAYTLLPADWKPDIEVLQGPAEHPESGLVYVGFVAIRDLLRGDVKHALYQCRQAGIDVKMITGDNLETARAIAAEVGLLEGPDQALMVSQEFQALSDEQVKAILPRLRLLARAQPLDKLRLVQLLQQRNEVVAVTGDGTNDAPALKRADVGLAMGRTGTDVAREASKIVLLDDAFSTIVRAVHWGRALYENIQRFLQFQLTINFSALAIAFLAPFFGVKPPFSLLQLLWINVIMDTLAAIALCAEPPGPGLMRRPPRRRDENIVTAAMLWNILTTGAFFVVVMLTLLLGMNYGNWFAGRAAEPADVAGLSVRQGTIFFSVYVFFQVWNEFNCRSLVPEMSGLQGLHRNRTFLAIVGLIVAAQVLIVSFGGRLFQVEPLGPLDWLAIATATASVLLFAEAARYIQWTRKRRAVISLGE